MKPRGFTIVETLIYMGLLSILMMVLTELLLSVLDVQSKTEATSNIQQDGRFLLARLQYDINRATALVTPAFKGTSTDSLQLSIGGTNHVYLLSGNDLHVGTGAAAINLNGFNTSVSGLTFTRIGNTGGREDTVRIDLTINSRVATKSGSDSAQFTTSYALRRN